MLDETSNPATAHVAGVAALFDTVASTYDTTGVAFFGPIADGLIEVLDPGPRERVLDLGCGRGAVLARLAPLVEAAVGVDVSPAMIAHCRAALAGFTNVRIEAGDAQTPDAELGEFDAITASLVLFFLPDPVAALRNWRARLRPGGRCVVSIFGPPGLAWRAIDGAFEPFLPAAMLTSRSDGPLTQFSPDSAVMALFTAAGFDGVRTVTRQLDTRIGSVEQWEAFSWASGQRAMWLAAPEPERPAIRAQVADILRKAAHPDGGYVLSQSVRYVAAIA